MCEGRPTAVGEFTYDVEILPLCDEHHHRVSPLTHNFASAVHGWQARLTELCNRFCTINCLCTTTNSRLDALVDLDGALKRWKDQIPAAHQPGHDVVADWDAYMHIAPLHLEYFNLLRAIHWAFLMSAWTNIGTVDERHRRSLRASDMRCLSAARSFVQTLNRCVSFILRVVPARPGTPCLLTSLQCGRRWLRAQPVSHSLSHPPFLLTENPVSNIRCSLHTDHYVTTSAVLFRAICENPARMAAKADLEHLRAVRLHLERDSFSGEWSSTLRGTMGSMLQIAERLVRSDGEATGSAIAAPKSF